MSTEDRKVPEFDTDINFWEIAAGEDGGLWPYWRQNGVVSIGWRSLGDLTALLEIEDAAQRRTFEDNLLSRLGKTRRSGEMMALRFAKEIKEGDVVFVRKGNGSFLGVGVVTRAYHWREEAIVSAIDTHKHVCEVRWLDTHERVRPKAGIRQTLRLVPPELKEPFIQAVWGKDSKRVVLEQGSETQNEEAHNRILFGPPGTGKTWSLKERVCSLQYDKVDARNVIESNWRDGIKNGRISFVTFHPGMTYEDFVEGFKPVIRTDSEGKSRVSYQVDDGVFKRIALRAIAEGVSESERTRIDSSLPPLSEALGQAALEDPEVVFNFEGKPKYVLVIDEINRANIARVLGELITLLEGDKRLGCADEQRINLPTSKKPFAVPPNLYIIGTMNTADRSIALIDVALRRRFIFEELAPSAEILEEMLRTSTTEDFRKKVVEIFQCLNRRLSLLLDKDHLVGHAWFRSAVSWSTLRDVFADKVIPLLQEYFQGSSEKLALVLGHPSSDGRPELTTADAKCHSLLCVQLLTVEETFGFSVGDLENQVDVQIHPAFCGDRTWSPEGEETLEKWFEQTFSSAFSGER